MATPVPGLLLDQTEHIVKGAIIYDDPPAVLVTNPTLGSPITEKVAQLMIQNYWNDLSATDDKEEVVALTFGKIDLLSILSQKDCDGIRFYFAKKLKKNFSEQDDIIEGKTLIAVGFYSNGFDIDTDTSKHVASSLKPGHKIVGYIQNPNEKGVIIEMVPPLTLGYFLGNTVREEDKALAKDVKKFFGSK